MEPKYDESVNTVKYAFEELKLANTPKASTFPKFFNVASTVCVSPKSIFPL